MIAPFGAGKEYFQKLAAIGHKQGHTVALHYSQIAQSISRSIHAFIELPVVISFIPSVKKVSPDNYRPFTDPFTNIQFL